MLKKLLLTLLLVSTVFAGTEDNYVPIEYDCDGGTTEFTFSFPVGETSDLEVILKLTATEVEEILTENTHYTVSATNNDYSSGGSVKTIATYANTYTLIIRRETAKSQDAIFVDAGKLRVKAIEDGLDKLTRLVQDLQEIIGRCLKIPKTETSDVDIVSITNRAGKNITFGDEGDVSLSSVLSTGTANISEYGETLIDDDTPVEARGTLGLDTDDDVEFGEIKSDDIITKGPWVDVRAFGAVGDGDTDSTAAFQAAIDAVYAAGGGIVVIPGPNIYSHDNQIVLKDNVWLCGIGYPRLLGTDAEETAIDVTGDNCTISGLEIEGPQNTLPAGGITGRYLIQASNVSNLRIFDNEIHKSGYFAIHIAGTGNYYWILNNYIYDTFKETIQVEGLNGYGVIANNIIKDSGGDAIALIGYVATGSKASHWTVAGNVIRNGVSGIKVSGKDYVTVTGNTIDTTELGAIYVISSATEYNSENVTVIGNTIKDACIDAYLGIDHPAIAIWGNATGGTINNITIADNVVKGASISSIWVRDYVEDFTVTGNILEGSRSMGIRCMAGDGIIANNIIKDCDSYGIILEINGNIDGQVSIVNNQIIEPTTYGISIRNDTLDFVKVEGNIIQSPGGGLTGFIDNDLAITKCNPRNNIGDYALIAEPIPVMTTGDATPSVLGITTLRSLGATGITDFDDGVENQVFTFIAETGITITDGTNIFLDGSANWAMTDTDTLTLICKADGKWYELSRGDNGA